MVTIEKGREYLKLLLSARRELLLADSMMLPLDSRLPTILGELHEECETVMAFIKFMELHKDESKRNGRINMEAFFSLNTKQRPDETS